MKKVNEVINENQDYNNQKKIKDEISKILELLIKDLDRRLEDKQIKLELNTKCKRLSDRQWL